jgi:hypothetical protein
LSNTSLTRAVTDERHRYRPAAITVGGIPLATAGVSYFLGIAGVLALIVDVLPSVRSSVIILASATLLAVFFARTSSMSLLTRLSITLYALPFSATIGYLFDPQFFWWQTPYARQLMGDERTMRILLATGFVGLAGLMFGISVGSLKRNYRPRVEQDRRVLGLIGFTAFIVLALFFSWLSAPTKTIFQLAYASEGSAGVATSLNFNAAYLVSYVLLAAAYLDAERSSRFLRRAKFIMVLLAAIYVVVFLQILRGDRESIGAVAALMALYVTSPSGRRLLRRVRLRTSVEWQRARRLVIPVIVIVVVFQLIGFVRSAGGSLSEVSVLPGERVQTLLTANTWTAVLLTNLGIAYEYQSGMDYLGGRTYLEYLQSLPPGVLTKILGVERPLEGWSGPAWWFVGLGAGGIHVALVPFKNFGPFGTFGILAVIGFVIASVDRRSRSGFFNRLLYASFITVSFFWFWYGDMYVVRAVMAAILAVILYKTVIFVSLLFTQPFEPRPYRKEPSGGDVMVT